MSTASTAEVRLDRFTLAVWTAAAVIGTVSALSVTGSRWGVVLGSAVLALARAIKVPSPSGDTLDIGLAVAAAIPLLTDDVAAIAAIYAFGMLASWLLLFNRGGEARTMFAASAFGVATYGVAYVAMSRRFMSVLEDGPRVLLAVTVAAIAWYVVAAVVRSLSAWGSSGFGFRYVWLQTLADWPVGVALVASGVLFALAWPALRWWAVPMATMAYGFSHLAFVRYVGTRRTYGQTIRALARIPEIAGLAPGGHAMRTAHRAVSMGRDLGLSPTQLTELEYGALMHDIGRITLNEPAVLKAGYTDTDIARWGAEIIAEAPYLAGVADAVRHQHEPFRRPGEELDESLTITSKIIKVASAYDQAVSETGLAPLEAVEVLHRGAAYDFDPKVVRALRRDLVRSGVIVH